MKLLSLDTESGGINLDFDLLSIHMSVIDGNYSTGNTLDLLVKPDPVDGRTEFFIQAEALRVNKINLGEHDLVAITYKDAKVKIYEWLKQQYDLYGTLTAFGNNIQRDLDLITKYTISERGFYQFVDRRTLDTVSIGKFLQFLKLIPEDQSLALSKITKYLGVEVDDNLVHGADYDTKLGTELLKKYHQLFLKGKQ